MWLWYYYNEPVIRIKAFFSNGNVVFSEGIKQITLEVQYNDDGTYSPIQTFRHIAEFDKPTNDKKKYDDTHLITNHI